MEEGIVNVPGAGPMRDQCLLCENRISKFYAYIYLLFLETLPLICLYGFAYKTGRFTDFNKIRVRYGSYSVVKGPM